MANADRPFGLKPIRHRNGAPYNGAANTYHVASTYGTNLFVGDPVSVTGTSNTAEVDGFIPGSLPEVEKTAAGTGAYLTGVIVAVGPNRDDLTKTYSPLNTASVVWVADDPDLVFEVQEDGDTTPLAETSVSANVDLIHTVAGSTVTGLSGTELDSSTVNTTNTLQMKIMRICNSITNEVGAFAKWEAMINLHTQRNTTGV